MRSPIADKWTLIFSYTLISGLSGVGLSDLVAIIAQLNGVGVAVSAAPGAALLRFEIIFAFFAGVAFLSSALKWGGPVLGGVAIGSTIYVILMTIVDYASGQGNNVLPLMLLALVCSFLAFVTMMPEIIRTLLTPEEEANPLLAASN